MDGKWIAMAMAFGVAIGAATDHLALGIAFGVAVGVVLARTRWRRA